jgi:pseudaminic acid biosynthesis-associated methylase
MSGERSTAAGAHDAFWRGAFGDDYVERNRDARFVAGNLALFSKVLARTGPLESAVEFGCNVGLNLQALAALQPGCRLTGVEINARAARAARAWGGATIVEDSFLDAVPCTPHTMAFTKGVLIHIDPARLPEAYDRLVAGAQKYVFVAEYYNPTPMTVSYRGHDERLFKRDFAGELLERHPELRLLDYGFCWRGDPTFPMDDLTWFLLEKRA